MNVYRGEILALYNTTTRAEARAMLSFLPLFLEAQYGSCVREWFSTECLTEMEAYHWDDAANCVVETAPAEDPLQDDSLPFFGNGDARDWELVEDDVSVDSAPEMTFDLSLHFQTQARANSAGCGFDDAQSMSTLATGTTNLTAIQYAPPQASDSLGSAQTGTPLGDDAPQGGGPTVPPPAMTDVLPDGVAGDGDATKAADAYALRAGVAAIAFSTVNDASVSELSNANASTHSAPATFSAVRQTRYPSDHG
mgnify:CR=1 FL=1